MRKPISLSSIESKKNEEHVVIHSVLCDDGNHLADNGKHSWW
jgi:hypothetical protein